MILDYKTAVDNNEVKIKGIIHIGAFYGQEKKIYDKLSNRPKLIFPLPNLHIV